MVVTSEKIFKVPVYKVKATDIKGAGDAFTGALAIAISEGESLTEAVHFANLTGSYCVTHKEVVPGLPTLEQLENFSEKNDIPREVKL